MAKAMRTKCHSKSTLDLMHYQKSGMNNSRISWIDYAKGIAIILVVLGHVYGGIINSKKYLNAEIFNSIKGIPSA